MSTLHLRLETPCTPEQLSLVALFAAEHGAETWSTDSCGHLVTAVDLDALTGETPVVEDIGEPVEEDDEEEFVEPVIFGNITTAAEASPSEPIQNTTQEADVDGPKLEVDDPTGVDGVDELGSEPASPLDLDGCPDGSSGYQPPLTISEIVFGYLAELGGRWIGTSTELAREVYPDNVDSARATIGKLLRDGELVATRSGRTITALSVPTVSSYRDRPLEGLRELGPDPEPAHEPIGSVPFDVDKARERAAAAL